jgi:hypothetical protein
MFFLRTSNNDLCLMLALAKNKKFIFQESPLNKYLPLTFTLLAASLIPQISNASSAQVSYQNVRIDSNNLKGASVGGSLDISHGFSLELWSGSAVTKINTVNVQLDQTNVGVGYNLILSDAVDLKIEAAHVKQTATASLNAYSVGLEATGFAYGAEITAELTEGVDGLIGFSKLNEAGSNALTIIGISVGVTERMDLMVSSSSNKNINTTAVGLKYNF